MNLQEFIAKYSGVDGVGDTPENKGECVGLIEVWIDNLGLSHVWGNAKDLLADADPKDFEVFYNNPLDLGQFPNPGDVVAWGASWGNGNGHTGVVADANGTSFHCFEQNNPAGHAPQIVAHSNYGGVLGWLRPKIAPITPVPTPIAITDQTKIPANLLSSPLYPVMSDMEVQAIRGILGDYGRLKNQPPPTPPTSSFTFAPWVPEWLKKSLGA